MKKIFLVLAIASIAIFLTVIIVVEFSSIALFGMDYVKEELSQKIRIQDPKIVNDLIRDQQDYSQECFWAKFILAKDIIETIVGGRQLIQTIEDDFVNEYGKKPTDAEFKEHALVMCERESAYEKSKDPVG